MATASEQKELTFNQHLETLDDLLEDGPEDGQAPEAFLRDVINAGRSLIGALEALTPEDVDEIWTEESEDSDAEI